VVFSGGRHSRLEFGLSANILLVKKKNRALYVSDALYGDQLLLLRGFSSFSEIRRLIRTFSER
jgi:hypothetical protein